jgi:hypothetical protein
MFLVGLTLWLATVVVTLLTGNPTLIPTLVILGSFLVPVTFVSWAFERRETGELTASLWLVPLWRRAPRASRVGWTIPIQPPRQ